MVQIRARQHADGTPAEAHVLKALDLPAGLRVLCIVTVGYPAETKEPKDDASLSWDRVEVR